MKRLSIVLTILMVLTLFAACSDGGTNSNAANSGKSSAASASSETGTQASVLKDGTVDELLMIFPGGNSAPQSLTAVEDAINGIIGETIDAKIKIQILEWGVYSDQINLMLSSGEKLDLLFNFSNTKTIASNGQIQSITDKIEEYAPDAYSTMEKYLEACYIDGELYGLPSFHEYASSVGLICRRDLLEETGIDPATVKSWEDVENILLKVREKKPDMNLLIPSDLNSGMLPALGTRPFDKLQSKTGVAVRMTGNQPEDVINLYDTEEYREMAEMAYDWNQKGYFIADATTITDTRQELLKAGNAFGYIGGVHPGTVTQEIRNSGRDVTAIMIGNPATKTSNVNFSQYVIPSACKTPEKALAFLNYLYTDPAVQNIIMYGIEGTDYVMKDEENQVVGYPEGIDNTTVGWSNEPWISGNASISYAWESDPPSIWQDYLAYNDSADFSPLYGFSFTTDSVKNEISAISNVIDKYSAVIASGYSDVDEALTTFNAELESAGIQKIIDEAKTQISQWLAEQ